MRVQDISFVLSKMNKRAATQLHVEDSLIWLIQGNMLVLYDNSSYCSYIRPNDHIEMKLEDKGITALSVRNPRIYNLNAHQIDHHPEKKFPGRKNMYLPSGETQSLLIVPLCYKESLIGILKLENKLGDNNQPIKAAHQSKRKSVFTSLDEKLAKDLADEFAYKVGLLTEPNPFNLRDCTQLRSFPGRENEKLLFRTKLDQVKSGTSDCVLILGHDGIGKTTLLQKFKEECKQQNIPTCLIPTYNFDQSNTVIDGVKTLIEQISIPFTKERGQLQNFWKTMKEWGIEISVLPGVKIKTEFTRPIKPEQAQLILYTAFQSVWKDLKSENECAVVLMDCIERYLPVYHVLSTLKDVVLDNDFSTCTKFLFVLCCTHKGWNDLVKRDSALARWFPYIRECTCILKELEKNDVIHVASHLI